MHRNGGRTQAVFPYGMPSGQHAVEAGRPAIRRSTLTGASGRKSCATGERRLDTAIPTCRSFPKMREHRFDLESVAPAPEAPACRDRAVRSTDGSGFGREARETVVEA